MKQKREGNTRGVYLHCELVEPPTAHVVSADSQPNAGSPQGEYATLQTSSHAIVYAIRKALPTGRIYQLSGSQRPATARCLRCDEVHTGDFDLQHEKPSAMQSTGSELAAIESKKVRFR
jgi:hypothetical protein